MPLHPVEPDRFRAVMGHFATGVAVVTATASEGPVGMTANAVSIRLTLWPRQWANGGPDEPLGGASRGRRR